MRFARITRSRIIDIWDDPIFQGSLQMLGGAAEISISLGAAYTGVLTPWSPILLAHGTDHFSTGLSSIVTKTHQKTATAQILEGAGCSPQTASILDAAVGLYTTAKVFQAARAAYRFSKPSSQARTPSKTKINEVKGNLVKNDNYIRYHPRIRIRVLQDPVGHNFPYTFDKAIMQTMPTKQVDGSLLFRKSGYLNGKEGIFEIGLNVEEGIIFHRTFRKGNL